MSKKYIYKMMQTCVCGCEKVYIIRCKNLFAKVMKTIWPRWTYVYSGVHISWHELFLAGNQSNHQNLVPSMLTYNLWLISWRWRKKNQNGRLKKDWVFQLRQFSIFFMRISGISPWVCRINWCKGHQCGSTYMVAWLSDISSKKG